jgi:hypothetical protein
VCSLSDTDASASRPQSLLNKDLCFTPSVFTERGVEASCGERGGQIDRCQKVCIPLELFGGLDRPKNQLLNRKTTMARPTVEAKFHFEQARKFASDAGGYYMVAVGRQKPSHNELGDRYFTRALLELADGLAHLSDGLRATYILLEQLKNEMPQR